MIQIQDDAVNQNVVQSQPVVGTSVSAPQSTFPADQTIAENTKNNAAEIDKLLAELDKLSKNLEDKPSEVSTPVAPNELKEDKFDFDSFLTDLEKKIDEEGQKKSTTIDQSMSTDQDFRKNRSNTDLDSSQTSVNTEETPVSAGSVSGQDAEQSNSEELRAQNIFEILGLMNISDVDKNQFLDELEIMIWDDFVVHDLELLLTSEEYKEARRILDTSKDENQKKEELIVYLEKLIPDLDEVLYEKALELKSEMMGERLNKMKENADEATLSKVQKAQDLISQNLWRQAATLLNS